MTFFGLLWRSLRQFWLSTLATVVSLSLGVCLMTAVVSLREQTHVHFTRMGLGVDAVLGPKGSPLQIVLNAVYHLEEMPGKVPWPLLEELQKQPMVERVIPFCSGHSFGGVRVNAIAPAFFQGFEYLPEKTLNFAPSEGGQGRGPASGALNEAVAGWEAARKLGIKLGDGFNPVCGVNTGDPVHKDDRLVFVGILARTGTPHDRAIYIPLERFFTLGGHGDAVARMATDLSNREVSGALVKIRKIRGGLMHPGVRDLKFMLAQNPGAQLVLPNEVLPQLFSIIGWVDRVLWGIAVLVVLMASLFLFVSLLNALRERRREYALLRCLGASRRWVFGLVLCESGTITAIGSFLGVLLARGVIWSGALLIQAETGVTLDPWFLGAFDILVIPLCVAAGFLTGLIPAIQAYRLNVLQNLAPQA
jgi:putative ABC transport system permease protein